MVIDIELTLNRFGFGRIAKNKFQFLFLRFSFWKIPNKYSISFEINWRGTSLTLKKLKKILDQNKGKKITVIGTTCVGKTTLLKEIPEGIEISKLAPVLSEEERDFYYNAPLTEENEERRLELRPRRAIVKAGQPAFGTGIANGTELIVYLDIDDKTLEKRCESRGVDISEAKLMKKFIDKEVEKSKLTVITINVVD
jgi:hypothetical protein